MRRERIPFGGFLCFAVRYDRKRLRGDEPLPKIRQKDKEREDEVNFDSYIEETRANAIEEIPQYYSTKEEALDNTENIYDNLFVSDSVTGNGSGSYTFDREKAKGLIQDAMYDDRFISHMDDMGFSSRDILDQGAEGIDVMLRCAALDQLDMEELINEAY